MPTIAEHRQAVVADLLRADELVAQCERCERAAEREMEARRERARADQDRPRSDRAFFTYRRGRDGWEREPTPIIVPRPSLPDNPLEFFSESYLRSMLEPIARAAGEGAVVVMRHPAGLYANLDLPGPDRGHFPHIGLGRLDGFAPFCEALGRLARELGIVPVLYLGPTVRHRKKQPDLAAHLDLQEEDWLTLLAMFRICREHGIKILVDNSAHKLFAFHDALTAYGPLLYGVEAFDPFAPDHEQHGPATWLIDRLGLMQIALAIHPYLRGGGGQDPVITPERPVQPGSRVCVMLGGHSQIMLPAQLGEPYDQAALARWARDRGCLPGWQMVGPTEFEDVLESWRMFEHGRAA